MIKLSPRLAGIAEKIPPCDTAADVGCDHAGLSLWLVQSGRAKTVYACDIRKGPLSRAKANIARAGLIGRIIPMLRDGLDGVPPCRTVIIAGMGGETIAGILSRAEWTKNPGCTLFLQPMTADFELREFLYHNGYAITDESYVREGDKLYIILTVIPGNTDILDPSELYASRAAGGHPLFCEFAGRVIHKLSVRLEGLKKAKAYDEDTVVYLSGIIDTLKRRREENAERE